MIFNSKNYTFSETYEILKKEIELLFISNMKDILNKTYSTYPQIGKGSFHRKKDLPEAFLDGNQIFIKK